jgi:glycine C-acetyltransferase
MLRLIPTAVHTLEDVKYTIETFVEIRRRLEAGEFDTSKIRNMPEEKV